MEPKFTYDKFETQQNISALTAKLHDIDAKEGLGASGNELRIEIVNCIADLNEHLEKLQPQGSLTMEFNNDQSFGKSNRGFELLGPNAKKITRVFSAPLAAIPGRIKNQTSSRPRFQVGIILGLSKTA